MRALPILFNGDMVRAILDGRKTVTRRVIKTDISNQFDVETDGSVICYINQATGDRFASEKLCRYQTGDVLYVRETWGKGYEDGTYVYRADEKLAELPSFKQSSKLIYHPSIHMPKAAARIWLKVTDVRVERLKDAANPLKYPHGKDNTIIREGFKYTCDFIAGWNKTIKKTDLSLYGWDANPRVWVIEFERCEKPRPALDWEDQP